VRTSIKKGRLQEWQAFPELFVGKGVFRSTNFEYSLIPVFLFYVTPDVPADLLILS
jgi:hypothetical protein